MVCCKYVHFKPRRLTDVLTFSGWNASEYIALEPWWLKWMICAGNVCPCPFVSYKFDKDWADFEFGLPPYKSSNYLSVLWQVWHCCRKNCSLTQGWTVFPKRRNYFKILRARRMTWSQFETKGPQTLVATVQSVVARATWHMAFTHPWSNYFNFSF
jgi:hypothetical protein